MELPKRIGRYVIEERIGRGGMAEVYRARLEDGGFQKRVCLKRVLPQLATQAGFFDMFRDEAALAARLAHPNLVQALDLLKADGALVLVLELVDGVTLKKLLARLREHGQKMPLTHALHIAICMCRGLHYAHQATSAKGEPLHVVHRDVSPDNVLIGENGDIKITDFGVARASERLAAKTATGAVKGKPGYMSPEQILAEPSDHRVDQFATGAVLFEMLAGRPLFDGKTDMDLAEAVVNCVVPPLARFRSDVSPAVEAIVRRALERAPDQRFPSMFALESALVPELYQRVRTAADVDVRALMERLDGEDAPTQRIGRDALKRPLPPVENPEALGAEEKTARMDTVPGGDPVTSPLAALPPPPPPSKPSPPAAAPAAAPAPAAAAASSSSSSAAAPARPLPLSPTAQAAATAAAAAAALALVRDSERTAPSPAAPGSALPEDLTMTMPALHTDRRLWFLVGAAAIVGAAAASVIVLLIIQERPAAVASASSRGVARAAAAPVDEDEPAAQPAVVEDEAPVDAEAADAAEAAAVARDGDSGAVETGGAEPRVKRKRQPALSPSDAAVVEARRVLLSGRADEAAAALRQVIGTEPNNADAHRLLGVAYARLKDEKRSAVHYKIYLGLRPDAPDADAVRAALEPRAVEQR